MSSATIILRNTASKINKAADYIDRELPKVLRDAEIRGFFILRHYEAPDILASVQQYAVKEWEPRVELSLARLSMTEYNKLRKFLGITGMGLHNTNYIWNLPLNKFEITHLTEKERTNASSVNRPAKTTTSTREEDRIHNSVFDPS